LLQQVDFLQDLVGPMILKTDGTVTRKETPPSEKPEGSVIRPLAGAYSWPLHMKNAFWEKWCEAA
jgi:hypothetical protein